MMLEGIQPSTGKFLKTVNSITRCMLVQVLTFEVCSFLPNAEVQHKPILYPDIARPILTDLFI